MPYIPLKTPNHTRMRTPLPQRIAAMPQALAPMNRKIVPRTISTTSPRSVSQSYICRAHASVVSIRFIATNNPKIQERWMDVTGVTEWTSAIAHFEWWTNKAHEEEFPWL